VICDVLCCVQVGCICNNAHMKVAQGDTRVTGQPTEAALLVVATKVRISLRGPTDFEAWRASHVLRLSFSLIAEDGGGACV
jgi:magnesium-transporting ATPase (P-type)